MGQGHRSGGGAIKCHRRGSSRGVRGVAKLQETPVEVFTVDVAVGAVLRMRCFTVLTAASAWPLTGGNAAKKLRGRTPQRPVKFRKAVLMNWGPPPSPEAEQDTNTPGKYRQKSRMLCVAVVSAPQGRPRPPGESVRDDQERLPGDGEKVCGDGLKRPAGVVVAQ
ncbi:hypothetical protein GWK47_010246 [Chionoecetes opilio]|uniref:Uncharacterized protein n=1 Tax=Chionoecetes opilio TaxID=41210 RepID=A0A8J4Y7B2_CHIOP|nr:hypothetical protein GWK47_010246 [Chionoecetes opilio]